MTHALRFLRLLNDQQNARRAQQAQPHLQLEQNGWFAADTLCHLVQYDSAATQHVSVSGGALDAACCAETSPSTTIGRSYKASLVA